MLQLTGRGGNLDRKGFLTDLFSNMIFASISASVLAVGLLGQYDVRFDCMISYVHKRTSNLSASF